ncbi:hypothetical protein QTJ16_000693 [Diplocarpon rosae]|uniref:Ankyrin n=1 Tax=Diplocarpon rosae TaxID=946125 RepID=A0AAD9T4I4_9HELO|nr:hypothetical protein QTJ16_000693 [Diplocarpon rosae]
MSLSALPNEVLLHISANITEQAVLKNFIYSNKRIYELGIDSLYQIDIQSGRNLAVLQASQRGQDTIMRRLLRLGADISIKILRKREVGAWREEKFTTALHEAAKNGHLTTLKLLLESGANTLTADPFGKLPIFHAIAFSHVEAALMLLEVQPRPAGSATVCEEPCATFMSALHLASLFGAVEVVQYLLQRGEAVDVLDTHEVISSTSRRGVVRGDPRPARARKTSLAYALGSLPWAVVPDLEELGIVVPTQGAERSRRREVVRLLLEAGADVRHRVAEERSGKFTLRLLGQTHPDPGVRKLFEDTVDDSQAVSKKGARRNR